MYTVESDNEFLINIVMGIRTPENNSTNFYISVTACVTQNIYIVSRINAKLKVHLLFTP